MTHQLNILLLSLGLIQGVLILVFLLRKKNERPANLFFILFILVISLQLAFKVISKGWLWDNAITIYYLSYNLPFLTGPLLYFFIRSQKSKTLMRWTDIVHFIPFVIGMCFSVVLLMGYATNWSTYYSRPASQLILLLLYGAACWKLEKESAIKGLKDFLIWVISAESIIIIAIALKVWYNQTLPDIRLLFVALTVLIYWISYKLLVQPDAFALAFRSSKYTRSGLKPAEADRIAEQLHELMFQKKMFLEPDLAADALAEKLNTTKHHLSQVINERFQKSYSDYLNNWRIEEAHARLRDPKFSHYSIAAIAFDSGFKSISTFNSLFKKQYRVAPSSFRS